MVDLSQFSGLHDFLQHKRRPASKPVQNGRAALGAASYDGFVHRLDADDVDDLPAQRFVAGRAGVGGAAAAVRQSGDAALRRDLF